MVSRPNHPRSPFGARLVAELDRQGVSARELARRMNPGEPDTMRRTIARWLEPAGSAKTPTPANRRAVEVALGLQQGALEPVDEEDAQMVSVLMPSAYFRRLVREEMDQREARVA